jgi:hypothetical protein
MKTTTLARSFTPHATGSVTVSLVHIYLSDGTDYFEVATLDTRPLDTRKHRWTVVESYATESRARLVFDRATGHHLSDIAAMGA